MLSLLRFASLRFASLRYASLRRRFLSKPAFGQKEPASGQKEPAFLAKRAVTFGQKKPALLAKSSPIHRELLAKSRQLLLAKSDQK